MTTPEGQTVAEPAPRQAIGPQPLRRALLALVTGLIGASVAFVVIAALPSIGRGLGLTDVRTVTRVVPKRETGKTISRDAVDARSRELFLDDDDSEGASELALVRARTSVYATPGKQRIVTIDPGTAVLIIGEKDSYYRVVVLGDEKKQMGWIDKSSVRLR